MAIFPGDSGGIGIGKEGTYGTAVASAGTYLQAKAGANIGKQQGVDEPDALTVTKLQTRTRGKWAAGGFQFIPNYAANQGMDDLLEAAFGSVSVATNVSTFSISDASPKSLTVWKDLGGYVDQFAGAKVSSLEWTIGQGFSSVSVDCVAQKIAHPAAETISHADDSLLMHSNDVSAMSIGGTSYLAALREISVRMDIPHTGEERLFLGQTEIAEPQRTGPRAVTVRGVIELRDATPDVTALIDDWEGNTNLGDLSISLVSGIYTVTLSAGELQCIGDPIPLNAGPAMWGFSCNANDMGLIIDRAA